MKWLPRLAVIHFSLMACMPGCICLVLPELLRTTQHIYGLLRSRSSIIKVGDLSLAGVENLLRVQKRAY